MMKSFLMRSLQRVGALLDAVYNAFRLLYAFVKKHCRKFEVVFDAIVVLMFAHSGQYMVSFIITMYIARVWLQEFLLIQKNELLQLYRDANSQYLKMFTPVVNFVKKNSENEK